LTDAEQTSLLRASGRYREHYRDHMLFSLALGTGLRESEIAALTVGDVTEAEGRKLRVLRRIQLRAFKGQARAAARRRRGPALDQRVFVPDATVGKLRQFLTWKAQQGESLAPGAPLFCAQARGGPAGRPLSTRTIRHVFHVWQRKAGFHSIYGFHCLRHTSISNLYARTKDILATKAHARHARVETTERYSHASDEELYRAVRGLRA
jgi:integrase